MVQFWTTCFLKPWEKYSAVIFQEYEKKLLKISFDDFLRLRLAIYNTGQKVCYPLSQNSFSALVVKGLKLINTTYVFKFERN